VAEHVVQQGEHISALAKKYKFFDYRQIWDDPSNAELKAKRGNPNVLFPGDVVNIPDKEVKKLAKETAQVHTFQVKPKPLKLRIDIKDYFDKPYADTPCVLEVDGDPKALKTDSKGLIEREIQPAATAGKLVVRGSEIEVRIGHLDPVEEESGQIARLNNLGYAAGPLETPDKERLRSAIEEFQADQHIRDGKGNVTGICDKATQAKLLKAHGC
jgi:hypothetical protein